MSSDAHPEISVSPDDLEVVPGTERRHLQGWVPSLASDAELKDALEKAFDYRGDVTLTRKDGTIVDGYLYDRREGHSLTDSMARVLPSDGSPRVSIAYADIGRIQFSQRDPAAGKSWDAWVSKYLEKRQLGQAASIEPDALSDDLS